jgi:hypothetical protein
MLRTLRALALICAFVFAGPSPGAPAVHRLLVRIVTGAHGAPAGAYVELRLREAGRPERRLPLPSDAPWPADSTRVIPVMLNEPLDPDAVARFSIYYRAPANAAPTSWEISSAEVSAMAADGHETRLAAPIQGLIRREGEIASVERATSSLTCLTDTDCDDGRACNGRERCEPGAHNADARGCVAGTPVTCPTNQVCMEHQGCRGMGADDSSKSAIASASAAPPPEPDREGSGAQSAAPGAAVQTCLGRDVLLNEPSGATRTVPCPSGTACVPQPNGTGICAPGR